MGQLEATRDIGKSFVSNYTFRTCNKGCFVSQGEFSPYATTLIVDHCLSFRVSNLKYNLPRSLRVWKLYLSPSTKEPLKQRLVLILEQSVPGFPYSFTYSLSFLQFIYWYLWRCFSERLENPNLMSEFVIRF